MGEEKRLRRTLCSVLGGDCGGGLLGRRGRTALACSNKGGPRAGLVVAYTLLRGPVRRLSV